jgi:predicted N-acyltransferase
MTERPNRAKRAEAPPSPPDGAELSFRVHPAIEDIGRGAWDALVGDVGEASPFMRYDWLHALEEAGCAAPDVGWTPHHLALWRQGPDGARLVAAAPAYVRDDSDGDFSRDWGWAEGSARAGIPYYPKLCVTVPFTPAAGRRFLVAPGEDRRECMHDLIDFALQRCADEGLSSIQVLFPRLEEARELGALGLAVRMSYQYQWRNPTTSSVGGDADGGYASFDDFLARFDSKKRNQIRRERRAPTEQGIAIRTVRGDELASDPAGWARRAHSLHRTTVEKLPWGRGWLNRAFYERVIARMPEHVEIVTASRGADVVAMAFNVASSTHLYGRYWGCAEEHPFLHFNVCLYHSIEQCIERGLRVFEGGAGGEHKLSRGFEPAETFSAHALLEPRLDAAVRRQIASENRALEGELARFRAESPILKRPVDPGPGGRR